ncbi:serine hydrolase domain-containing protein [Chitinophagaceae bacterium LWZ2-11]
MRTNILNRLLFISLCLSLLLATNTINAQNIKRINNTSISSKTLTDKITRLMDTAKVTGMAVSVFNNNKPVYTKAFGYANDSTLTKMDTGTVFWACSFSKAVFGYFVMKMVDKKIINLDTPLVHYLPKALPDYTFTKKTRGYKDIKDDKRYEQITARMCLDHTTGFPNYRGFEADGKLRIKFDPGTRYSYSGEGLYLLQFVLEQITGKDFETLAQEEVFRPLNMTHSSYVWQTSFNSNHCIGHDTLQKPYEFDERTTPHAAGSMYTNITDFSLFIAALLQKPAFINEMFKPQIPILSAKQFGPLSLVDDKTPQTTNLFYGLSVGLLKTPYGIAFFKEGHSEGWGHYSIAFPDKGIAIIIMTNSDNGERIFKELLATAIGDVYTPWYWENYTPYK